MLRGEKRVELARLRMRMRNIDAEIAALRRESRRYREMRFGLDIKEIQLTALQDQRDACNERIGELLRQLELQRPPRNHPLAWLLLPFALWLPLRQALATRLVEPAPADPDESPGAP
jgi:hypothetical protein